ncbi:hypothetical protein [Bordetella bronchiseptica]|uniref:hypothetical protein n=1 Tax=Bordetella bronchiseptica TaxID=518 RepID=UPI001268CC27|nr:hypothetical protein [Bordetella bronchiseptica]
MRQLAFYLVSLLVLWGPSKVEAASYGEIEAAALAGDYQAQRNLAFGYTDLPYAGQKKDPVQACAWRMVIMVSGMADSGDAANFQLYCGRLEPSDRRAAMHHAGILLQKVASD